MVVVGGAEGEEGAAAAVEVEEGVRTNRAEDIRTRRGREDTIARWPRWVGSSEVRTISSREDNIIIGQSLEA